MEEWLRYIGRAKAAMDNGFSRVGPGLRADGKADAALARGAGRVIRLVNAVALMCKHHHAEECGPLLETLVAVALAMRWVAVADEAECRTVLGAGEQSWNWREMDKDPLWADRLRRGGVDDAEKQAWGRAMSDRSDVLASAGSCGLPWSHIFTEARKPNSHPEKALKLAVRAMGHALKALETRWPGSFQGAEELWIGF